MNRWQAALHKRPVILDGPMGTAVEDAGYSIDDHPLWGSRVFLEPGGADLNDRIHRRYLEAGADVLIANTHNLSIGACLRTVVQTFGADRRRHVRARDLCETLNQAAMASVGRVAQPDTVRAACLMSPDRPYAEVPAWTADGVAEELSVQARILAEAGVDLMIFEMVSTEPDLEGALRVGAHLGIPWAIGLTCGRLGRTRGGVCVERAALRAAQHGAAALFVQCTPVDGVEVALHRLRDATLPIGAYANDGRRWDRGWQGCRISAGSYARAARRWLDLGIRAVGGCCGTTEEHVRALVQLRNEPDRGARGEARCTESTEAST